MPQLPVSAHSTKEISAGKQDTGDVACTLVVRGRALNETPRVMDLSATNVCLLLADALEPNETAHLILTNRTNSVTRTLQVDVRQVTRLSSGGVLVNCRFRTELALEDLLLLL